MVCAKLAGLYRYPVKGLSAESLTVSALEASQTVPYDRAYAIECQSGVFNEAAPRHLPKVAFLCLMRDERLASLQTRFDPATAMLSIARDGVDLVHANLTTLDGRSSVEAFLGDFLGDALRGPLRVVSAAGHSFSDVREKCIHIINLASVRALEAATGRVIDPMRFRANVILEGLAPWAELDLVGREATLGGARVSMFKRTVRCAATDVDPKSGVRDGGVPEAIFSAEGHRDFGVYAMVTQGGTVRTGDPFDVMWSAGTSPKT